MCFVIVYLPISTHPIMINSMPAHCDKDTLSLKQNMEARIPSTYPNVCKGKSWLRGNTFTIHIHIAVPTTIATPLSIKGTFATMVLKKFQVSSNDTIFNKPYLSITCPLVMIMLWISAIINSFMFVYSIYRKKD